MSHPYQAFVTRFAQQLSEGCQLPLGDFPPAPSPALEPDAPRALVFSPHPDDESLIGALALRLRRQAGYQVVVVAVTQGSNEARQTERWQEMSGACGFLGWELQATVTGGLTHITPTARQSEPAAWNSAVAIAVTLILKYRPKVIIMPHEGDGHSTHQGTHLLVLDALRRIGPDFSCAVVLTEFWAALAEPNLMVESPAEDVADLMAALSFHKGEVRRNPYHVLLPSWMSDNVRRGSERVGGQGGAAAGFTFATLYRLEHWDGQCCRALTGAGRNLPFNVNPATLFGAKP